jgi:hypothetical protein
VRRVSDLCRAAAVRWLPPRSRVSVDRAQAPMPLSTASVAAPHGHSPNTSSCSPMDSPCACKPYLLLLDAPCYDYYYVCMNCLMLIVLLHLVECRVCGSPQGLIPHGKWGWGRNVSQWPSHRQGWGNFIPARTVMVGVNPRREFPIVISNCLCTLHLANPKSTAQ